MYCEFFEPDEHGNICHASENDECPNYSECTAMYDIHGNPLQSEESGCHYQNHIQNKQRGVRQHETETEERQER